MPIKTEDPQALEKLEANRYCFRNIHMVSKGVIKLSEYINGKYWQISFRSNSEI